MALSDEEASHVANLLRKSFENQAKAGMIDEAIQKLVKESGVKTKHNKPKPDSEDGDGISFGAQTVGFPTNDSDSLTIGPPFAEDEESTELKGATSATKENIPFTEKEKQALKEAASQVNMEILNNAATISWDGAEGLVKITIVKSPQAQQKNFVYSATSKIDNNLDKTRTINSRSFETVDDVDILTEFLASLKLNEEEELNEEKKTKVTNPLVRIKYVNAYPIRNERAVKNELIGNIRYKYVLAKDIKEHKPKMKHGKKSKNKRNHTEVKIVANYPVRDGEVRKSETIGNVTYRYKTKADKKKEAEKRRLQRKKKYIHEEFIMVGNNKIIIRNDL